MTSAIAYPLQWPSNMPRAQFRYRAKFGNHTSKVAYDFLKQELVRLGAEYRVISTNIPLKVNGEPYSDPGKMPDPGVACYFRLEGKPYCLPSDKWDTVEHNLWAVGKHVEAMRGMQRWGVGSIAQQFAGFAQLTAGEHWSEVLKVPRGATLDDVQRAYKLAIKTAHPDAGGSEEAMQRLNAARDQAGKELKA